MTKKRMLALILSLAMLLELLPAGVLSDTLLLTSNELQGASYAEVVFKNGEETMATQLVEGGTGLIMPEDPAKAGFVFKEWHLTTPEGEVVTKDTTFTPGQKYTVVPAFQELGTHTVTVISTILRMKSWEMWRATVYRPCSPLSVPIPMWIRKWTRLLYPNPSIRKAQCAIPNPITLRSIPPR